MSENEKLFKYIMMVLSLFMLIGIVMVYSSSYLFAKENFGSSVHFFTRQIVFSFLGLITIWLLSKISFLTWYNKHFHISAFFTFLLILTVIPQIGVHIKGSYRWIQLGKIQIQPGEFIKYSIMPFLIFFFENFKYMNSKKRGLYISFILTPLLILIFQPDFGSFTICLFVLVFICFLSTFPRSYFYGLFLTGILFIGTSLFLAPYRVQRILTFLDPWKDPQNSGFQIIQSYLAFANGGIWGKGIGNSNEKLFYLPEAYNDFILSVVGEELGLIGVILIIVLFLTFIFLGFKLALNAENKKASLMIASVFFTIGLQACLNMGVVLGLLPTKGLNLPFISYGGSSMLANCIGIGLAISAAREKREVTSDSELMAVNEEVYSPLERIMTQ